MKTLTDRLWLVLLGIAVAVLVTLTTIVWSGPMKRSGTVKPASTTLAPQTILPRIATKILQVFSPEVIKPNK